MKKTWLILGVGTALLLGVPLTTMILLDGASRDAVDACVTALKKHVPVESVLSPLCLAVVDFTKPSFMRRMTVVDFESGMTSHYWIAHGRNSGQTFSTVFSNQPRSNMSSLGLYKVMGAYNGAHGKSLRLQGLDPLQSGNAFARNIVLHGADYVSIKAVFCNLLRGQGPRLGCSNGCFAVSPQAIDEIVEKLDHLGYIYAYGTSN